MQQFICNCLYLGTGDNRYYNLVLMDRPSEFGKNLCEALRFYSQDHNGTCVRVGRICSFDSFAIRVEHLNPVLRVEFFTSRSTRMTAYHLFWCHESLA